MPLALVIQHAMRMRHIVICGLPLSTIFFHIYLGNVTVFEKKKLLNTKCVLICSTYLSETLLILRRTERDEIKYVCRSSCKVLVIVGF